MSQALQQSKCTQDTFGPRLVGGEFLSPKGLFVSNWTVIDTGSVALDVSLPVGVSAATSHREVGKIEIQICLGASARLSGP